MNVQKVIKAIKAIVITLLISLQIIYKTAPAIVLLLPSHLYPLNSTSTVILAQNSTTPTQEPSTQINRGADWEPPEREVREGFWAWLRGLGRRGPCSDLNPPLIALFPTLPSVSENIDTFARIQLVSEVEKSVEIDIAGQGVALTISEHPSFWFNIPEQASDAERVEFMIQTVDGQDVFDGPLQANVRTGLVNIQLPETLPGFQLNQPYHWYFSIICEVERPSRNPSVDGWTERVALRDEVMASDQNSLREVLDLYSQENIWHETIELIAKEQCNDPTFDDYWAILLNDILPDGAQDWITPRSYCVNPEPLEIIARPT